jgi:hypothetical protein
MLWLRLFIGMYDLVVGVKAIELALGKEENK